MKTAKINTNLINFEDRFYSLSPIPDGPVSPKLLESISRTGILHPPILKETGQGMYVIAAGRNRLHCNKNQLKINNCTCHIIDSATPPIETWTIIIDEIQQGRSLTAVEKAEFFKKITSSVEIDSAAAIFLPLMGEKPQVFIVEQLLKLAELEEPIKIAIQNGSLDQKTAKELVPLSFRDRFALFDIMLNLQLSVGNQKKIVTICKELQKRSKESVLTILSDPKIREIITSVANVPQKATNLMKYLTERLSPQLTKARKDYNEFIKTINLPDNATLSHSQSFESDSLTLKYYFDDREQFIDFWNDNK